MQRRDMAALAFVLMGLYALFLAIQGLQSVAWIFEPFKTGQVGWLVFVFTAILVPGLLTIAGMLLVVYRWQLADWLFEGEAEPFIPKANAREVHTIAFCVLGAIVLIDAIPHLGYTAYAFVNNPGMPDIMQLIALGLKLVLGLALVFGADTWVGLWQTVRFGGTGIQSADASIDESREKKES